MTQLEKFDYTALAIHTRTALKERSKLIRGEMKKVAESALRIGEALYEARGLLAIQPDSTFEGWLEAEFGWSRSQAYSLISVYETFGARPNFGQLDIAKSALYLLAQKNTPPGAVEEAVDRAAAGEQITHSTAKGIVASHTPQPTHGFTEGETVYYKGYRCVILLVNGGKVLLKSMSNGQRTPGVPVYDLMTEAQYEAAVAAKRKQQPVIRTTPQPGESKPLGIGDWVKTRAGHVGQIELINGRSVSLAGHNGTHYLNTLTPTNPLSATDDAQSEQQAEEDEQLAEQVQRAEPHQFAARDLALTTSGHVVEFQRLAGSAAVVRDPQNHSSTTFPEWLTYIDPALDGAGLTHEQVMEIRAFAALELQEWNAQQGQGGDEEETRSPDEVPSPPTKGSGEALKLKLHAEGVTSAFRVLRHKDDDAYTAAFDSHLRHSQESATAAAFEYATKLKALGYVIKNAGVDIDKTLGFNGAPTPMIRFKVDDGDEWYTPDDVIAVVRNFLGTIDLDPASCEAAQRTVQAATYYDRKQNGLLQPWFGNVWLNAPYSQPLIAQFTGRLLMEHAARTIREAVTIVNNRTDARWFQQLLRRATSVCFVAGPTSDEHPLAGRINFEHPRRNGEGNRQGQAFFYCGSRVDEFASVFDQFGVVLPCRVAVTR